jgi:acyl carrier protein
LDYVAPRSDTEKTLAGLWAEILVVETISIHDNFFELGGHSLLATQLISRIRRTFGVEASLHRLFETPTVAGFADYIETIRWTSGELASADALGSSREEGKI